MWLQSRTPGFAVGGELCISSCRAGKEVPRRALSVSVCVSVCAHVHVVALAWPEPGLEADPLGASDFWFLNPWHLGHT